MKFGKMNILTLWCGLLLLSLLGCKKPEGYEYGHFERVGDLNIARVAATATLLKDGRVLIAGGFTSTEREERIPVLELEIYDPKTRRFSIVGKLHEAHTLYQDDAPLLPDGRVVFIGGPGRHAEMFDPKTNQVTLAGEMKTVRERHSVTVLKDGTVLVAGGEVRLKLSNPYMTSHTDTNTAEIFNPQTGVFTPTGKLHDSLASHHAFLLADGRVVIIPNYYSKLQDSYIEFYEPQQHSSILSKMKLLYSMRTHAILLPNGNILIIGGPTFSKIRENSPQIINFQNSTIQLKRKMPAFVEQNSYGSSATLLDKEQILITGTNFGIYEGSAAVLYDVQSDRYFKLPNLNEGRAGHTATLLRNGTVLIAGGRNFPDFNATVSEIFIPSKKELNNGHI